MPVLRDAVRSFVVRILRSVSLFACALLAPGAEYTALDRYVAAPDDAYRYELRHTAQLFGVTIYQADLVSQRWRGAAELDRPEWRHTLTILRPARLETSTALLFISGGSNDDSQTVADPQLLLAAAQTGAILIHLAQVPNQPIQFAGESSSRSEDAIIAYSWDRYLKTGDENWPARLPMTKAVVRAMDAASALLSSLPSNPVEIANFVLIGGSKRGWTAWTAAAVDPRVIAIAPVVADFLNLEASFIHHWRAYGFWAPAIRDYQRAGIMAWIGTPQLRALFEIEDPYEYRQRLTLPKYLVNSAGDQFFLPDSSQFYFDQLPGEKHLRYVPNTDHSVASPEALLNILAWFRAITQNKPRPRFHWRVDREGAQLVVRTIDVPSKVLLWQAVNPNARDFRLETIGAAWESRPVEGVNGIYTVPLPKPDRGWAASFVELTFPGFPNLPLVFTTEVVVTPDVYPFDAPPAASTSAADSLRRRQ